MLQGFFDESGFELSEPICVIAGFVASARQWQAYDVLWEKLGADAKFPGFHSKYFFARDAATGLRVGPYEGWSEDRAETLLDGMTRIVRRLDLHPIVASVDVQAFRQYSKEERAHLTGMTRNRTGRKLILTGSPRRPYYIPFQDVVTQALEHLKRLDWQVHFVFDQQTVLSGFALKLFNYMKTAPGDDWWARRMGACSFESRLEAPPLQAADLFAYCCHRVNIITGTRARKTTKDFLKDLECKGSQGEGWEGHHYSRDTMDKLLGKTAPTPGRSYKLTI